MRSPTNQVSNIYFHGIIKKEKSAETTHAPAAAVKNIKNAAEDELIQKTGNKTTSYFPFFYLLAFIASSSFSAAPFVSKRESYRNNAVPQPYFLAVSISLDTISLLSIHSFFPLPA